MDGMLRDARPDDAEAAAPLVWDAGPEFLRHVLGLGRDEARARAFVEIAFRLGEGPLSWRHARVAVDGVRVCGVAVAWSARDGEAGWRFGRALWRSYSLIELSRMTRHALHTLEFVGKIPGDVLYLSSLGVSRALRGRGVGARLVKDAIARAEERGRRVMLHVSVDNEGARRLYERLGFNVVAEHRHPRLEARYGLPGQFAMVR